MADTIAPIPDAPVSTGLRFIEIETIAEEVTDDLGAKSVRIVPKLGDDGREIEVAALDVPLAIEAEGAEAIEEHVAQAREAGELTAVPTDTSAIPAPTPTPEVAAVADASAPVPDTTPQGEET